jgi:hypothetical protein
MNENTQEFKKGDRVLYAVLGSSTSGQVIFYCKWVVLQSWGARQGTAIQTENGKNLRVRIYRDVNRTVNGQPIPVLFRSVEEVEALAKSVYQTVGQARIDGALNCEVSNFNNLRVQFRPAAEQRIAALRASVPSYEIKVEGGAK